LFYLFERGVQITSFENRELSKIFGANKNKELDKLGCYRVMVKYWGVEV
jgi:hypothetical protein